MIDNKFTEEIQSIVQSESVTDEQIVQGVMLLRRIAPGNMTYMRWQQLANSRPTYIKDHVLKELKKHLSYRLDELTRSDVRVMDDKVQTAVSETLRTPRTGKREDHNSLPDQIRALWDDSAALYIKIKDKFEECKALNDQQACDRYEVLKVLAELDETYRKNMKAYDDFVANTQSDDIPADDSEQDDENYKDVGKIVGAARTYISKNIAKLEALVAAANVPDADADVVKKRDELRQKVCDRVAVLIDNKAVIGDALAQRLNAVGIGFNAQD